MSDPVTPKRVSQQLNQPLAPEDDIGPFYKLLAGILTVAACALLVLHGLHDKGLSWIDVGMIAVVGLFVLALIRPTKFDSVMKSIADKLPFLQYKKD